MSSGERSAGYEPADTELPIQYFVEIEIETTFLAWFDEPEFTEPTHVI
jgi:hypothetical protein